MSVVPTILTFPTEANSDTSIVERFAAFIYTPYGVAIIAALAIIITSTVWTICCCVYCCCRYKRQEGGVTEANRDLLFFGNVGPSYPGGNGTLSSGYNTGSQAYSVNGYTRGRNGSSTAILNTSLDSMLDETAY